MTFLQKCFGVIAVFSIASSLAQAVEVKATITHPYEGGIFSSGPTDEDKVKALREAKLAALKIYGASMSLSEQKIFDEIRPEVLANLDEYVPSWVIVAQDVDKDLKTIRLVVRAVVDDSLIGAEINKRMPAGAQATGDGSLISALFVGRQVTSSTVFDEKISKVREENNERDASANNSATGVSEAASSRSLTTTGGSTTRKSSRESYAVIGTSDFDSAFNEVLSARGYETSNYADVYETCKGGAAIETIRSEVLKNNEISSGTRSKAIRAARECEVRYFTIGRMDVSAPMKDSVSGNLKVVVSVTGRVWDIAKKVPRNVASVGPIQSVGFGEDEGTARRKATYEAPNSAARRIAFYDAEGPAAKAVADTLQSKRIR